MRVDAMPRRGCTNEQIAFDLRHASHPAGYWRYQGYSKGSFGREEVLARELGGTGTLWVPSRYHPDELSSPVQYHQYRRYHPEDHAVGKPTSVHES